MESLNRNLKSMIPSNGMHKLAQSALATIILIAPSLASSPAYAFSLGDLSTPHVFAQSFKMPNLDIYLTVNEVRGKGRYREAFLTWSAPGQQRSQHRQIDCNTKKYIILSEGGKPSGPMVRSLWMTDDSGVVKHICSK